MIVIRPLADHYYVGMRHALLAALAGAALLAGCGDDDGATSKPTGTASADAKTTATIKIVDFVYDPTPATVKAGEKIAIPNADAAPHTITDSGSGKAFDSGTITGKATGSLTIAKAGTYAYICEFHPFMKGEITVTRSPVFGPRSRRGNRRPSAGRRSATPPRVTPRPRAARRGAPARAPRACGPPAE